MLLAQGDRLEDFMAALDVNQKEKAIISKRVWDGWLRVMPDRLTAEAKVQLGNFAAVLKTIIQAQANHEKTPIFHVVELLSTTAGGFLLPALLGCDGAVGAQAVSFRPGKLRRAHYR